MSKQREFDDLKGLPPEKLPHNSKPIPNYLDEVKVPTKPNIYKTVKLGWSDVWNIIKAVFRNESLNQLEGSPGLIGAALSLRYTLYLFVGVIALVAIVWGLKSIL